MCTSHFFPLSLLSHFISSTPSVLSSTPAPFIPSTSSLPPSILVLSTSSNYCSFLRCNSLPCTPYTPPFSPTVLLPWEGAPLLLDTSIDDALLPHIPNTSLFAALLSPYHISSPYTLMASTYSSATSLSALFLLRSPPSCTSEPCA